jgi:redox-sensitive bicupin YhaK (pirin superfamily)
MGNVEFLKRGGVQLTCAGTGITHSEEPHGEEVHFLQIWAFSHTSNLKPKYFTRNFEESEKEDKWAVFIAPVGTPDAKPEREATGPAPIHSNLYASATLLSTSKSLVHTQRSPKAYVHVPQISGYNPKVASGAAIRITSADGITAELHEGDGAYIVGERGAELTFSNIGDRRAEIVVLDVDAEQ